MERILNLRVSSEVKIRIDTIKAWRQCKNQDEAIEFIVNQFWEEHKNELIR
jgi:hypothetical protein